MAQAKDPNADRILKLGRKVIAAANAGDEYRAYQTLHDNGLHVADLINAGYTQDQVEALMNGFRKWFADDKRTKTIH
jgi:hypothetical protein